MACSSPRTGWQRRAFCPRRVVVAKALGSKRPPGRDVPYAGQPGEVHGALVANSSSLTWGQNGVWCTPPAQPAQAAEAAWMEDTEAADLHTHGKRKRRIYREHLVRDLKLFELTRKLGPRWARGSGPWPERWRGSGMALVVRREGRDAGYGGGSGVSGNTVSAGDGRPVRRPPGGGW